MEPSRRRQPPFPQSGFRPDWRGGESPAHAWPSFADRGNRL